MISTVVTTIALCGSPAGELNAALSDLRRLPPAEQTTTRYLSAYNVPAEQRDDLMVAVSLVLNHVSRSPLIVRPTWIPGTSLLRWNLAHYAASEADVRAISQTYESLVSADPYWHLRTQVFDPETGQPSEVFTDGGWVGLEGAAELRRLSASGGALLRADWFVVQAAGNFYYALAGVPQTRRAFFAQLGIDIETIDALQADEGANLFVSGITGNVRRIVRRQGPLGAAWETFDVEASTPERDPFRNPFEFVYDAGEHIAAMPNGLHRFALFNAQGDLQATVPDVIAKDTSDPHGDGIVRPMISCVRCHVEDGLRPFANHQKRLLETGISVSLDSPARASRFQQFYRARRLERALPRDRDDYATAVHEATGVSVEAAAAALAGVWDGYLNDQVTPETAARELCGDDLAPLRASGDPVLLALIAGLSVQREQWEASFAEAALLSWGNN